MIAIDYSSLLLQTRAKGRGGEVSHIMGRAILFSYTNYINYIMTAFMLKNKGIPNQVLSRRNGSIHDPINLDNIANTTGRNAAPNQDRPSTVFH